MRLSLILSILALFFTSQLAAEARDWLTLRSNIQHAASSQDAFRDAQDAFHTLEGSADPIRWDFHALMTSAAAEQENFDEVQRLLKQAPEDSELSVFARYYHLIAKARMNQFQGDLTHAKTRFDRAYELARELKDASCMVTPLIALAFLHSQEGNTQQVLTYLQKMQALEGEADPPTLSVIYAESAGLYYDTGDYRRAVEYGEKAVALAEKVGNKSDLSAIHSNVGLFQAAAGDAAAALKHRLRALELTPDEAGPSVRARRRLNVGVSLQSLKRHAEAYEVLKNLPSIFDQAAMPRFQVESRRELAAVLNALGRIDESLRLYQEAYTLLDKNEKTLRNEAIKVEILEAERAILANSKRWAQAYEKAAQSIALSEAIAASEREKGITEFRIKYDTAVKEKEKQQLEIQAQLANLALDRERESNEFYRTLILTLGSFVLILSVLIFTIIRILRQLQIAKALTEKQAQEIATIFATIDQGIFTVKDDQLYINHQMSRFAREHFQVQAGIPFPEFLAQNFDIPKDQLRMVTSILSSSIDMLDLGFMTDSDKLPKELTRTSTDGLLTYEVDWVPIIRSQDKRIDQFLICIRNVTEFRKLKSEWAASQDRLHFMGRLAECGRRGFQDFHGTWTIMKREIHERPVQAIFQRHVHTLKGMARTLNFPDLSNLCHSVEEVLAGSSAADRAATIQSQTERLSMAMKQYEEAARTKLGWDLDEDVIHIQRRSLEAITRRLLVPASEPQGLDELLRLSFASLKGLISTAGASLPELARALQKPTPELHIEGEDLFLDEDRARMVSGVLPHLLRNACDHGIENEDRRRLSGKPATGTITFSVSFDAGHALLEMRDDGQGLDIGRIRELAKRKGLVTGDDVRNAAEWAELIFHSGFSTSATVSDISGRGIGMDAVRELVKEAGGTITLQLERPESVTFEAQAVSFVLSFPALTGALSEAS